MWGYSKVIFIYFTLFVGISFFTYSVVSVSDDVIINPKNIDNIDDSNVLSKFTHLRGYKSITFDVSSSDAFDTNKIDKINIFSSNGAKNIFRLNNLEIETEYKEIDTSFFNTDERPIKQKYLIRNLLNNPRNVKLNIKHEIDSSTVIWNHTSYQITKTPKYFRHFYAKSRVLEENETYLAGHILYFRNNYYDFKDVINSDYKVSVYSRGNKNYIDLEVNTNLNELGEFLIDPEIGFTTHVIQSFGDADPTSVYAIDVDADSDIDVLSSSYNNDLIAWYENDGNTPISWTSRTIATSANGARSVFAIDLDNDTDIDVISGSDLDDEVEWYENDGNSIPSWTTRSVATAEDNVFQVYADDLNNDSRIDIMSALYFEDQIHWYENDGSVPIGWTTRVIDGDAFLATSVHSNDLDKDNDVDVVGGIFLGSDVKWYENDGSNPPSWTTRLVDNSFKVYSIYSVDINKDNNIDIIAGGVDGGGSGGEVNWYENDGSNPPSWTKRTVFSSSSGGNVRSVYAIDMDNDGDIDILSASRQDNRIAWYENDNSGLNWIEHNISTSANGAWYVFAKDIDGDGDIDALSASIGDDQIKWYESDLINSAKILNTTVLQVVEDVDLVKDKNTLVRANVKFFANESNQTDVTVNVYFNGTLKNSKNKTMNGTETETFDLFFTPDLSGTNIEIKIEAVSNFTGTQTTSTKLVNKNVTETRDLNLFFVPINNVIFDIAVDRNVQFLRDTYPVKDGGVNDIKDSNPIEAPQSNPSGEDLEVIRYNILSRIFLSKQKFTNGIGIVEGGYLSNWGATGINFDLGKPDVILLDETQLKTLSHEVGHTFELCEEYNSARWSNQNSDLSSGCPNGDLDNNNQLDDACLNNRGCSTSTLPILYKGYGDITEATNLRNFMGDWDTPDFSTTPPSNFETWISEDSFNALLNRLDVDSEFETPIISFINHLGDYVIVRIFYENDNNFTILPSYELESGFINNVNISKGNHSIDLLDGNGDVISNISFEPNFNVTTENGTTLVLNRTFLVFSLPSNENLSKIRFKNISTVLREINKTQNAPRVSILKPLVGEEFSNELINVSWNATDLDGDNLNFTVLLTGEDVVNITLGLDIGDTELIVNSSNLQDCDLCKIKVLVTDGVNTNSSVSNTFSINNDLQIHNLSIVHSNNRERIFRFNIFNSFNDSSINNINWSLNTGESTIDSQFSVNLVGLESIFNYVFYNYTTPSNYTVIATAFNNQFIEIETIEVEVI